MGRIQSQHLDELKAQMNDNAVRVILDLHEVTLVDADVVQFLSASEEAGITLVRCPLYIANGFYANEPKDAIAVDCLRRDFLQP